MKALVTGATGLLGSALVPRLLADERYREIRCLTRPGSDRRRLQPAAQRHPDRVELHTGSLASIEGARTALGDADVVFHLAAALRGPAADIFASTVVATKNLLEAVASSKRPIRFVLVGSIAVHATAQIEPTTLIDETSPLEPHPERRDLYTHAKLRQETLCRDYQKRFGLSLTVLRPGVLYGPGAGISTRVGLSALGVFWQLGGDHRVPLSFVGNCADALTLAGARREADGETYLVLDDDLPTCRELLARYRSLAGELRVARVPYAATLALSHLMERYHQVSKGQLPAVLTPYKVAALWRGHRYSNAKLHRLGWRPRVGLEEGMWRAYADQRAAWQASASSRMQEAKAG